MILQSARFWTYEARSFATIAFVFFLALPSLILADDVFVSPTGNDSNPGTLEQPLGTLFRAMSGLNAGDTLYVLPGVYRVAQQTNFVRRTNPQTFAFEPLVGSASATTRIIGVRDDQGRMPRIYASLDVRGSYIEIFGLQLIGTDAGPLLSGIAVFDSHDIHISNCTISEFGGSGISFNQSDIVSATGNIIFRNAFTNPNQSSGISLYQNVVRTNSNARYGAVIRDNVCALNENQVGPNSGGAITDGNGIIIDDFLYTQQTGIIEQAIAGIQTDGATGVPVIEFDGSGNPLNYSRDTLVYNNITYFNGGRGIHVFLSDRVDIFRNLSFRNLTSPALTDGLPRDANGNPFFVYGEINLTDSQDCRLINNLGLSLEGDVAGAAEQFFSRIPGDLQSNVFASRNSFFNIENPNLDVDVHNVQQSDLFSQAR